MIDLHGWREERDEEHRTRKRYPVGTRKVYT